MNIFLKLPLIGLYRRSVLKQLILIKMTVTMIVGFKYHLYITSFNYYRDGDRRCQHFECNYFISYRTDNIDADIELSGKSNGWVAIGFSSDKKMVSYFYREMTHFCKYLVITCTILVYHMISSIV